MLESRIGGAFPALNHDLWETTGHNPVLLLGTIEQAKLEEAARDDAFLAHLQRVESNLAAYLLEESTWFRRTYAKSGDAPLIAYFSAEFGLTECLSIFAGGLGILAGDHLKSASDLKLERLNDDAIRDMIRGTRQASALSGLCTGQFRWISSGRVLAAHDHDPAQRSRRSLSL